MARETLSMETKPNGTEPESVSQQQQQQQRQHHPASGSGSGSYSSQQQPPLPADCMPCKIVGCAGFGGLGLYSFYQAQQLPSNLVARRLGLGLMGTAFIGAAIYRLTMPINQEPSPLSSSSSSSSSS